MSEPGSEWRRLWREIVQEVKETITKDQQPVEEENSLAHQPDQQ